MVHLGMIHGAVVHLAVVHALHRSLGCAMVHLAVIHRHAAVAPGRMIHFRRQGGAEFLPRTMKVADSGLKPTETVEIIWQAPSA